MYIPGNMSGKNELNWSYSLWTIELKPTQLWPPQKSTFCDRSVWLRHGEKYHQPAMASHWDESSGSYSMAHCPNNADVATVYSILRRHRENPGDVKDRPRSGRRRATTGREDRALVWLARQQRYATTSTICNHWPTNVIEFQPEQWGTDSGSMGTCQKTKARCRDGVGYGVPKLQIRPGHSQRKPKCS